MGRLAELATATHRRVPYRTSRDPELYGPPGRGEEPPEFLSGPLPSRFLAPSQETQDQGP